MVAFGALIVVLGVLIFVHELGHFIAAKSVGIAVPRFSIGLGPQTPLKFRRGETEFVLSWIPFGGYVKMASKEELEAFEALEGGEVPYDFPDDRLFENKPLWARMVVILAGVTMNVIFAWATYFVLSVTYGERETINTMVARFNPDSLPPGAEALGDVPFGERITAVNGQPVESFGDLFDAVLVDMMSERLRFEFAGSEPVDIDAARYGSAERGRIMSSLVSYVAPLVGSVGPSSAAERAGLEPGDLFLRAGGDTVLEWSALVGRIEAAPDREMSLDILRGGEVLTLSATPGARERTTPGSGVTETIGYLGVSPYVEVRHTRYTAGAALGRATSRVGYDVRLLGGALAGLFLGRVSPKELGGPILIGQVAGQFAQAGLEAFLGFLAMFSVNLAILNLLPIPVLDGGQFVVLAAEGLRGGKPLPLALRLRLTQVGLFVLLGLMVYVMTADVLRTFGLF